MKLDFDDTDQITDYVTVPEGTYLCRITDVRERETRSGDSMWALRLSIAEGEFTGRDAAWDNLVFSSRGLTRVKTVFRTLGLPTSGKVEVEPADLTGREVFVTVRPSEYHAATGGMVRRNEVPYDGYRAVVENEDDSATQKPVDDDTIPF